MEPAQSGVATGSRAALAERSVSLAGRLLAGAGRASVVAYDLVPMVEASAISHGLTRSGELVVACVGDVSTPVTTWRRTPLRVRLDVVKEAPEFSVRITACAVHLLGTLHWLPDQLRDEYLADGEVHPRVAEVAAAPGGRLGVVQTDRVLLHDCAGVTPLSFEEVVEHAAGASGWSGFPDLDQEWAARDLVGRLTADGLGELLRAASSGWDAAVALSSREGTACPHVDGQVYCVDVDGTGLTLMEVEKGASAVTMLAFDEAAGTLDELADRLLQLTYEAQRTS
ncbi:MAG: hypothetical protein AAGC63_08100 [Propionicimonas sp.]|nr:hypothetical protein [Propionicimonas sp.]